MELNEIIFRPTDLIFMTENLLPDTQDYFYNKP